MTRGSAPDQVPKSGNLIREQVAKFGHLLPFSGLADQFANIGNLLADQVAKLGDLKPLPALTL